MKRSKGSSLTQKATSQQQHASASTMASLAASLGHSLSFAHPERRGNLASLPLRTVSLRQQKGESPPGFERR